jgi:hypothetical protein
MPGLSALVAGSFSGQSPEGHRVPLVRRGLGGAVALCGGFPAGAVAWAGGIGAGRRKRRPLWYMIRGVSNQGVGGAR